MTDAPYGQGDASYQAAGGWEGICALVNAFYDVMDSAPMALTSMKSLATLPDACLCCFAICMNMAILVVQPHLAQLVQPIKILYPDSMAGA